MLLALLLTPVTCLLVYPQKHQVRFDHLDIDAGLSQNNILCILQDSKGFMWFGTRDGLNKYDGYHFTIYKNDVNDKHSISNNFISAIVEDANGIIWITTRVEGLTDMIVTKTGLQIFKIIRLIATQLPVTF